MLHPDWKYFSGQDSKPAASVEAAGLVDLCG
jgi:hypothetical protein